MNEKDAPYKLCLKVLKLLEKAGILQEMVLIGSWCIYFYQDYFATADFSILRTRDMDFLIESPSKITKEVDLKKLLAGLGFITDLYDKGSMRLVHPDLLIDFMVPRRGRAEANPVQIRALGVNAHPLRYMEILLRYVIPIRSHGLRLRLPHPVHFAFHKLLVSTRRQEKAKKAKDLQQAVEVLRASLEKGEGHVAAQLYKELPPKQQNSISRILTDFDINFPGLKKLRS